MRVVLAGPGASPEEHFGGRGHYIEKVARVLAAAGHDVHVLHLSDGKGTVRADGVTYVGVAEPRLVRLLRRAGRGRFRVVLDSLGFGWAAARGVRRLARSGVDAVIVSNAQASGLLVQWLSPAPVVLFCMGHMPTCNALKYREGIDQAVVEKLESWSMDRAEWVYAPSELTASLYDRDRGRRRPVRVVRTPIDPEFVPAGGPARPAREGPSRTILFFAGLLEDIKGGHVLAEAFGRLHPERPDLRLTVVGQDHVRRGTSARDRMRTLAGAAAPAVDFVDFVGRDRLHDLIVASDVVALPSLFDNLPNTLLESLQSGAIVVGTRGASFDELIVDGESGFLATAGSVDSLVDALRRAVDLDGAEADRVRAQAMQAVSALSPGAVEADLVGLLEEVVRCHRPRRAGLAPSRLRRRVAP